MADEIKEHLTDEEWKVYYGLLNYASVHPGSVYPATDVSIVLKFAESLAAERKQNAEWCEEIKNLKSNLEDYKYFVKQRNEKIAECRRLMEKHQYKRGYCLECGLMERAGCKLGCLWAQAIKGE